MEQRTTTKPRPARTGFASTLIFFLEVSLQLQMETANAGFALSQPYALAILPLLMQLAQTLIRLAWPFTSALTACKFTLQRRLVMLWA
jgi:hypothetical protein